jgi:low affinity Fe/Cu permease
MVFLIQNTQNRDTLAVQIKENLHKEYCTLAEHAEKALEVWRTNKKPHLVG